MNLIMENYWVTIFPFYYFLEKYGRKSFALPLLMIPFLLGLEISIGWKSFVIFIVPILLFFVFKNMISKRWNWIYLYLFSIGVIINDIIAITFITDIFLLIIYTIDKRQSNPKLFLLTLSFFLSSLIYIGPFVGGGNFSEIILANLLMKLTYSLSFHKKEDRLVNTIFEYLLIIYLLNFTSLHKYAVETILYLVFILSLLFYKNSENESFLKASIYVLSILFHRYNYGVFYFFPLWYLLVFDIGISIFKQKSKYLCMIFFSGVISFIIFLILLASKMGEVILWGNFDNYILFSSCIMFFLMLEALVNRFHLEEAWNT